MYIGEDIEVSHSIKIWNIRILIFLVILLCRLQGLRGEDGLRMATTRTLDEEYGRWMRIRTRGKATR
jgi:hypothetical protein